MLDDRDYRVRIPVSGWLIGGSMMEKPNCEIIQDLLLSYSEGMTGESITRMLEEHLAECNDCRQRYQDIMHQREKENCEETSKGKKFVEKLKGIRKYLIGFCVGAILSFITIVALAIVFLLLFFYGGPPEVVTDISKYEEMIKVSETNKLRSPLITFPEKIPESASDVDYYFSYQDTLNTPTVEIFLQCTYDEEDYYAELQRLENTTHRYGTTTATLWKIEEGRYPNPAYIAIDGLNSAYEYALLSGENQITYIYTACKHEKNLKKIEERYLPDEFDYRMDEVDDAEKYSIYTLDAHIVEVD